MKARFPLQQIIIDDLLGHNKVLLLLLALVIMISLVAVWGTHKTRQMTTEFRQQIHKNQKLQDEYAHLRLEENEQSKRERVESLAERLGLQKLQKEQEIIILVK